MPSTISRTEAFDAAPLDPGLPENEATMEVMKAMEVPNANALVEKVISTYDFDPIAFRSRFEGEPEQLDILAQFCEIMSRHLHSAAQKRKKLDDHMQKKDMALLDEVGEKQDPVYKRTVKYDGKRAVNSGETVREHELIWLNKDEFAFLKKHSDLIRSLIQRGTITDMNAMACWAGSMHEWAEGRRGARALAKHKKQGLKPVSIADLGSMGVSSLNEVMIMLYDIATTAKNLRQRLDSQEESQQAVDVENWDTIHRRHYSAERFDVLRHEERLDIPKTAKFKDGVLAGRMGKPAIFSKRSDKVMEIDGLTHLSSQQAWLAYRLNLYMEKLEEALEGKKPNLKLFNETLEDISEAIEATRTGMSGDLGVDFKYLNADFERACQAFADLKEKEDLWKNPRFKIPDELTFEYEKADTFRIDLSKDVTIEVPQERIVASSNPESNRMMHWVRCTVGGVGFLLEDEKLNKSLQAFFDEAYQRSSASSSGKIVLEPSNGSNFDKSIVSNAYVHHSLESEVKRSLRSFFPQLEAALRSMRAINTKAQDDIESLGALTTGKEVGSARSAKTLYKKIAAVAEDVAPPKGYLK